MTLKAFGCNSLCGTNSATVVRMIPTFPFDAPANDLEAMAQPSFREKPKQRLASMVQTMLVRMMGFRPNRSEARPQAMPVRLWLKAKTADVMPAHFATSALGTWNDSIISG